MVTYAQRSRQYRMGRNPHYCTAHAFLRSPSGERNRATYPMSFNGPHTGENPSLPYRLGVPIVGSHRYLLNK